MTPTILLATYASLIVLASLLGGFLPSLMKFGHRGLQFVLSFVAGVMLGVGFFHMLPHAVMLRLEASGVRGHALLDPVMLWTVAGFLALFILERFSHFHQHEPLVVAAAADASACPHDHGHAHEHRHAPVHEEALAGAQRFGWLGALAGLGIHSILEGVALAASVAVGAAHGGGAGMTLAGLATFLVIVLHKPFDSMTLTTLMKRADASLQARVVANILLAALVPAGIVLFTVGASGEHMASISVAALAFSAGMFLCIASSDLLPELQFHHHDRVGLSAALLVGLGFAFVLGRFEASMHEPHGDEVPALTTPAEGQDAARHDHDHDHAH